ncbi:probable LRR receptor-like serine/threonine-protein kinase At4g29180 isoform X2 [Prosopis cineraria]|uniref:probable LRR receptor-like serine/threonine-protein kinase At4g29180 isoform X2 n=1 Tax=Prosopis cineraria TaxID=364024 RepID=UPI00241083E6|nr:probable LRR receptor-like serine/threonine-protein kinase At4g29180 isoform X2 [Prosopis cineraria]
MTMSIRFISLMMMLHLVLMVPILGQQQTGFISIDCGGPENFEYTDDSDQIKYSADGAYIQTGINKNISVEYSYPNNPNLPLPMSDLRSFPRGNKNCYTLRTGRRGSLHLIRAYFLYGNYDGKNRLPEFDLYIGVNFWSSVTFKNASEQVILEIISMAESEVTNVCLVNKGLGIPFISALELRPLNSSIYNTEFGASASLLLFKRWDLGETDGSGRYEDDMYDRIWHPYDSSSWDSVSTSHAINGNKNGYRAPSEVMRTAARPKNFSVPLEFSWTPNDPNLKFYVYLYFAEVKQLEINELRKFRISWNGHSLFGPLVPSYLVSTTASNLKPLMGNEHRLSLHRTEDSTLPPILNAVEIFEVRMLDAFPTLEKDVNAMMGIKNAYGIQRNWQGDPCEPKNYTWEGLTCNYSSSHPPRIVSLNLSSSSLTGVIASAICNLLSLEALDLSNNSLSGSIPKFLVEMRSLKILNLKGNQLSGFVPTALLKKSRAGLLKLSVDAQNLCGSDKCEKKLNVFVPIVATISSLLVLLIAFIIIRKVRRIMQSDKETSNPDKEGTLVASKKWQYSYADVWGITSNFKIIIGKGGFGIVYRGQMKDGSQVAVKILSPSSSQGPREFQTEAELLMTVHHKNLVAFIGYCDDGRKMALIYEYMANGNLKNYLSARNSRCLSWGRRLQIAIDAAQGLEYLHHGCKPPIIHRDVKTANILLGEKLEAKIADFGLSKVFENETRGVGSSMSASDQGNAEPTVMGTKGYYKSRRLNEKSDIYSFGIVLLELITGQSVVLKGKESVHILDWLRPELRRGDLSKIVDPKLQGKYNACSVWKALGVAMACTAPASIHRPTMSCVLSELKKCFETEVPSQSETYTLPAQIYGDLHCLSETYSLDDESITYPFPR